MKTTTERSIYFSPFTFGVNATPITIIWLFALAIVGILLLWLRNPFHPPFFARKQRKLQSHPQINISVVERKTQVSIQPRRGLPAAPPVKESKSETNESRQLGFEYSYVKVETVNATSSNCLQLSLNSNDSEHAIPTIELTTDAGQFLETSSDSDNTIDEFDASIDSKEINNNLGSSTTNTSTTVDEILSTETEISTPDSSNNPTAYDNEAVAIDTGFEANKENKTIFNCDALNFEMVRQTCYTTRVCTSRARPLGLLDNDESYFAVFRMNIEATPSFKDFLFDLNNTMLPMKVSEVKKFGFYIKWNNGHPNFFEREPFDPGEWNYMEPKNLPPLDHTNLDLSDNFPEGPNETYNQLTRDLTSMNENELVKLGRSFHLGAYNTIDQLCYRIRKSYDLQINAMEARKTSMAGWVPNFQYYQQLYPMQEKAWFDYVVVVDFECTCEDGTPPDFQNEIIQFPDVLIDTRRRTIIDEFNVYFKPTENPKLTAFCTNLTGITQETVNDAPTFPVALQMFTDWIKSHRLGDNDFTILTDGPTDMGKFLLEQCQLSGIDYPAFARRWINIRKVFSSFYGIRWFNLKIMMNIIGMPFEGCHHNGADDARNIATIFIRLLQDGCLAFQNEQIVLEKSLQHQTSHQSRSFYLNTVIPFPQHQYNHYNYSTTCEPSYSGCSQVKNYESTHFYLPEIFSSLGNKENSVVHHKINGESVKKRERKLFNVVAKLSASGDNSMSSSTKSKNFSSAASRS